MEARFKVGDHISYYDSYWGRRTGVIVQSLGLMNNVDGPRTQNFVHRFVDDERGTVQTGSEKRMKTCKSPTGNAAERSYAECYMRFRDSESDELVIIALKPMEELGIEEDDATDRKVFFYCDGLDGLISLTSEDSGEDFTVTEICRLLDWI